jgi:signal transduction histidine kinase
MINLCDNAARHTVEGDEIAIGVQCIGGQASLWVRDCGPGVEPAMQSRLFSRFSRGAQPRDACSTGLGLAIVASIAKAHGGTVDVDSEVGKGATFILTMPLRTATTAAPELTS